MTANDHQPDVAAITALIEQVFAAISWTPGTPPDWTAFSAPLHPAATFWPAARPAKPTAIEPFIAMMQGQYDSGGMRIFEEDISGHHIRIFGRIAVALSGYTQRIDGGELRRGVNGFLLVKEEEWRIAAMCWDNESVDCPVPADLR